jgi:AmmeMemoRadiSam system protein B/AmmeMemoRadiSam system protein A
MVNMENCKKKNSVWLVSQILFCLFVSAFLQNLPPAVFAKDDAKPTVEPNRPSSNESAKVVFHWALAYRWYPSDANVLSQQINGLFQKAKVKQIDNVIALILPHAGYQYSGQTAAMAVNVINREYKRVIIIGPSHYVPMEEVLSVPRATHYQTPLGLVPTDVEFINKLLQHPIFQNVQRANEYEHSVQMEIPLLQYKLKSFKIVPIVAGSCSLETINKAADILKNLVDSDTLVVISSDFVHYGPNFDYVPFKENVPGQIKKLDADAYKLISALDYKGFLEYRRKTGATICGYVPIAILLAMLPSSAQTTLVNRTTSGELMGDYTNSVSYLSIAFSGKWPSSGQIQQTTSSGQLTPEDKKQLLSLARKSINSYLRNQRILQESDLDGKISVAVKEPRAAFVTLTENSQLRGCIGDIFPQQPLYKSVITNAINAATRDWRFNPVSQREFNDIKIEISALTAPTPISSPDKVRIGIDGVVLKKNGRSAVFLPQVAPEQGWDVNQTLTHLSVKAGLPPDAWKEGASFLVFQAEVFSEEK